MMTVIRYQIARSVATNEIVSACFKSVLLSRHPLENGSRCGFSKRSDEGSDSDDELKRTSKDALTRPHDERSEKTKSAMSSSILNKILSMKVTGTIDDSREASTDLAKPTGKWRNVKKKMLADYEAEKELEKVGLNSGIISAVKEVATSLSGNHETTEAELLKKLKDHGLETEAGKSGNAPLNLSNVVTGMKIDRKKSKRDPGTTTSPSTKFREEDIDRGRRATTRASLLEHVSLSTDRSAQRRLSQVDLFGAKPLNIFTDKSATSSIDVLPTLVEWEKLERKELDLLVFHPPANGFEEMITWTKQGKLWLFPIDNEQGLDEEAKVGFHEHVFLEPLIADGFPKKGPIRHFMELVIVGLSKNPYMSVQRKKEHIDWFRQYFQDKEETLKEVGALN